MKEIQTTQNDQYNPLNCRDGPTKTTTRGRPPISINNIQESVRYNNPNQPYTPMNPATYSDRQCLADTFTTRGVPRTGFGLAIIF